jgi:hypothetical protein
VTSNSWFLHGRNHCGGALNPREYVPLGPVNADQVETPLEERESDFNNTSRRTSSTKQVTESPFIASKPTPESCHRSAKQVRIHAWESGYQLSHYLLHTFHRRLLLSLRRPAAINPSAPPDNSSIDEGSRT